VAVGESWGVPGADPADAVKAQCQLVLQDALLDHGLCWLLELLHQIQIVCSIWDSCLWLYRVLLSHRRHANQCASQCVPREQHSHSIKALACTMCQEHMADLMCSMALGGRNLSRQGTTTSLAT